MGTIAAALGVAVLLTLARALAARSWTHGLEFVAFSEDPGENLKQLIWPALALWFLLHPVRENPAAE